MPAILPDDEGHAILAHSKHHNKMMHSTSAIASQAARVACFLISEYSIPSWVLRRSLLSLTLLSTNSSRISALFVLNSALFLWLRWAFTLPDMPWLLRGGQWLVACLNGYMTGLRNLSTAWAVLSESGTNSWISRARPSRLTPPLARSLAMKYPERPMLPH